MQIPIQANVSERLDVMPAKFRVIGTRRPKYAFKTRTALSRRLLQLTSSRAAFRQAQIAVSKYADGLRLYRQEVIYAHDKVELDRKLIAQRMGKLGF